MNNNGFSWGGVLDATIDFGIDLSASIGSAFRNTAVTLSNFLPDAGVLGGFGDVVGNVMSPGAPFAEGHSGGNIFFGYDNAASTHWYNDPGFVYSDSSGDFHPLGLAEPGSAAPGDAAPGDAAPRSARTKSKSKPGSTDSATGRYGTNFSLVERVKLPVGAEATPAGTALGASAAPVTPVDLKIDPSAGVSAETLQAGLDKWETFSSSLPAESRVGDVYTSMETGVRGIETSLSELRIKAESGGGPVQPNDLMPLIESFNDIVSGAPALSTPAAPAAPAVDPLLTEMVGTLEGQISTGLATYNDLTGKLVHGSASDTLGTNMLVSGAVQKVELGRRLIAAGKIEDGLSMLMSAQTDIALAGSTMSGILSEEVTVGGRRKTKDGNDLGIDWKLAGGLAGPALTALVTLAGYYIAKESDESAREWTEDENRIQREWQSRENEANRENALAREKLAVEAGKKDVKPVGGSAPVSIGGAFASK